MEAISGLLMPLGAMTGGGYSAGTQQAQINSNICDLVGKMNDYKKMMGSELDILNGENVDLQNQATALSMQINTIQYSIRKQHEQFKTTYKIWSVSAIIFMIILIFIFASKIIILKSSTTR